METIGIVLSVALTLVVIGALVSSFKGDTYFDPESDSNEPALEKRDRLVRSLTDVEIDYSTGKVSLEDYNQLRSTFEQELESCTLSSKLQTDQQ